MSDRLSLRAFGRLVGVSDTAVRKAIRSGRLRRSVGKHGGRPIIVDRTLAMEEWQANATRPAAGLSLVKPKAAKHPPAGAELTLVDIQKQIALERMRKLKTENDVRAGELLEVDSVRQVAAGIIGATRSKLLAVPHVAVVMHGVPRDFAPLLRTVIHEALQELADLKTLADLAGQAAPVDDVDG